MWAKIRSIWTYVAANYVDDFDYFHLGGDDLYVIAENLRHVVSTHSWNHSAPLLLGSPAVDHKKRRFLYCMGGAGYTLNGPALKLLMTLLPTCWPNHLSSEEDRIITDCFRSVGVRCKDTRDDKNEIRFVKEYAHDRPLSVFLTFARLSRFRRYHNFHAEFHSSWTWDKPNPSIPRILRDDFGIVQKELLGQVSTSSATFHLRKVPREQRPPCPYGDGGIRRYHAILYNLCDSSSKPRD